MAHHTHLTRFAGALLCVGLILMVCLPCPATIIDVPGDEATVSAAVDAAAPGDTVRVHPGTYVEHIQIDEALTIEGATGGNPGSVILSGGGSGPILYIWATPTEVVSITGIRFENGNADGSVLGTNGGAIRMLSTALELTSCSFSNNIAEEQGGALSCYFGSLELTDCVFTGNEAASGGAFDLHGTTTTISGCTFQGNTAGEGGALVIAGPADVDILDDTVFDGNSTAEGTSRSGGGGAVRVLCPSSVYFNDVSFTGNTALGHGGAVLFEGLSSEHEFWFCTFEDNECYGESVGGAIHSEDQDISLVECSFSGNVGPSSGGAVSCWGGNPTVNSCSFTDNDALSGGALAFSGCGTAWVSGSSFTGNEAGRNGAVYISGSDQTTVLNCDFDSNLARDGDAGALGIASGDGAVQSCTFWDNESREASALNVYAGSGGNALIAVESCTFASNRSTGSYDPCVVQADGNGELELTRCIVAFNSAGAAAHCDAYGAGASITCSQTCIYGNELGDWTDCIAGQESQNDNSAVDPRLCGILEGELRLCADSPCLPENNVPGVLIGALGWGCAECGSAVQETSWGAIKALYR